MKQAKIEDLEYVLLNLFTDISFKYFILRNIAN